MLKQLITERGIRAAEPLDDASCEGFVSRAQRASGRGAFSVECFPPPRTRRDFIQALHVLGARSRRYRMAGDDPIPRTIPLHISCPYRTWLEVFGKPSSLEKPAKPTAGVAVHLWKHACDDGPVTCIGQISERLPGLRWVVVMRVGFYG